MTTADKGHSVEWRHMVVRPVTEEDILFWGRAGDRSCHKVEMRGDHIGAANIEVLRCVTSFGFDSPFIECWRVPYVVDNGEAGRGDTTYWFTMFCEGFPAVSGMAVTDGR